jgi:hypothetical protein
MRITRAKDAYRRNGKGNRAYHACCLSVGNKKQENSLVDNSFFLHRFLELEDDVSGTCKGNASWSLPTSEFHNGCIHKRLGVINQVFAGAYLRRKMKNDIKNGVQTNILHSIFVVK